MWIKRIELTNWRVYHRAVIEIPRGDSRSNVVVIGAKNGFGKTSLLEAVTLCLFGMRGLGNLVRTERTATNESAVYNKFLCGAFHRLADLSSPKASVLLVFEADDSTEISVERVWHFGANREFRGQEDLFIRENGEDLPIPVSAADLPADRLTFLAAHIAQRFLPWTLSPFFLFDSLRVQRMARRDMKEQVRDGIEATLGVPIVNSLVKDLHDYATQRRNRGMAGRASDAKLESLRLNIERGEAASKEATAELQDLTAQLERAGAEEDEMVRKFENMDGDSVAGLGELRLKSGGLKRSRDSQLDTLAKSIVGDFAMSLAGTDMLSETATRLRAETARVDWERDKKRGEEKYAKFVLNLERMDALSLPLSQEQAEQLRDNLKRAWDDVWYPPPAQCASKFLNASFSDGERASAIAQVTELSGFSIAKVKNLRESIKRDGEQMTRIEQQIALIRGDHTEEVQQLLKKMREKRAEIAQLEKKKGDCERRKGGVENELSHKREEFGRETKLRQGNDPILNCSNQAEKAVKMIEQIIGAAYSHHVADIAKEMTCAYVSMAHKRIVSKIRISDDCDIELLTDQGNNIRETLIGLGESQIFTLALIAAIARVSKNRFPFIVDTPLANLDNLHRREFLRYFSSDMDNQILLLSTDEEIREEQMNLIRHRLAAKFLIEQEHQNGIARSIVRPNKYFGEIEE